MNILHTSDWHLGRPLYNKKRYAEQAAFLDWLLVTIQEYRIDALLVAGDIFDSSLPSNRAQALYYNFLGRVAASRCRHVLVTAGNHDSPTLLEAPRDLLAALDVHVVGSVTDDLDREIVLLRDAAGKPELVVCAVPFLRDQDIRRAEAGETGGDKEERLLAGIRAHYGAVFARAEELRRETGAETPLLAMGHLFAAGGTVSAEDGTRELYVGNLARVEAGIFPDSAAYVALGHLHSPQKVGGQDRIRYSGAPLAMNFDEANQRKSVCLVRISPEDMAVETLAVPSWQRLERVSGDWSRIAARLAELATGRESVWLEVSYERQDLMPDLRERLEERLAGTQLDLLRVQNRRTVQEVLALGSSEEKNLDELDPVEVFARCLDAHEVPEAQRAGLIAAHQEIVQQLAEEDRQAE